MRSRRLDPIALSEGHNSGNVWDTTMELVYVTLKPCRPLTAPRLVAHNTASYSGEEDERA